MSKGKKSEKKSQKATQKAIQKAVGEASQERSSQPVQASPGRPGSDESVTDRDGQTDSVDLAQESGDEKAAADCIEGGSEATPKENQVDATEEQQDDLEEKTAESLDRESTAPQVILDGSGQAGDEIGSAPGGKASKEPQAKRLLAFDVTAISKKGFWRCGIQFRWRDPVRVFVDHCEQADIKHDGDWSLVSPDEMKRIQSESNLLVKAV